MTKTQENLLALALLLTVVTYAGSYINIVIGNESLQAAVYASMYEPAPVHPILNQSVTASSTEASASTTPVVSSDQIQ
jgi:hypothetical protein